MDTLTGSQPDLFGRLTSPVMVGRHDELAVLIKAAARTPALILVEGESGVGKSRLIEELLARPELAGRQQLLGHCHELSEPFPLGAVLDAVHTAKLPHSLPAVTGVLRAFLPELAEQLPPPPPVLGDPAAERHRLFRALVQLLAGFGGSALVVEDLHWADRMTLDFLRFAALQAPPGLAIIGSYRPEDVTSGSPVLTLDSRLPGNMTAVRVRLQPLGPAEIRDLVRTILDAEEVSATFADYLFERTSGLPLVVEEVLLLLKQRRNLIYRQGAWVRQQLDDLAVPRRLRDAVNERLDRVSTAARAVVQAAAVLMRPADEQLLAHVAELDERAGAEALAEALASALLVEHVDGYSFRHALARQGVEEAISAPLRRQLHVRAACALEEQPDRPFARLAQHYRAAGETSKWVHYAEAAADQAVSLTDHATAYSLLREAVFIPALSPETRGRLAIKLARHASRSHAFDDAIALLRSLLARSAMPSPLLSDLRFDLGGMLWEAGDLQAARSELLRVVDGGNAPAAARAMSLLAVVPGSRDSIGQRLSWLDRALEIIGNSTERGLRIEITGARAVLLVGSGDRDAANAIRDIPSPGQDPHEMEEAIRAYLNVADAFLHRGDYSLAAGWNARGLQLASEHAPSYVTNAQLTDLQLDWLTGAWEGLEQRLLKAIDALEDWHSARNLVEALLGLLRLAQGDLRFASDVLRPFLNRYEVDIRMLSWVAAGSARIELADQRADAAVDAIAGVLSAIRESGGWIWAADLLQVAVEALIADERQDEARDVIDQLAAGLPGREAPAANAALATCRGLLAEAEGKPQRAALAFERADEAWQALPRPYEAARARSRAGQCLLSSDETQAYRLLSDALQTFEQLGAGWYAEHVRHVLRLHGLLPTHRRGRRSYGVQLSPREAQVAKLAAEGLSNREIARTLFVSVKTIEHHLSSASRKLGVRSRTELSSQLLERADAPLPPERSGRPRSQHVDSADSR